MNVSNGSAGYSGTPLPQKLGLRTGQRVAIIHAPPDFVASLGNLSSFDTGLLADQYDYIHFFTTGRADLEIHILHLKAALRRDGMIWISWPKGASGVKTDLKEGAIRELALEAGLVDVKVCSIDATWSGLKLVFRLRDR